MLKTNRVEKVFSFLIGLAIFTGWGVLLYLLSVVPEKEFGDVFGNDGFHLFSFGVLSGLTLSCGASLLLMVFYPIFRGGFLLSAILGTFWMCVAQPIFSYQIKGCYGVTLFEWCLDLLVSLILIVGFSWRLLTNGEGIMPGGGEGG